MALERCECGRLATWNYMPGWGDEYKCDNCVERGCSCNEWEGVEDRDAEGRLYPCCEWNNDIHGFDDDSDEKFEHYLMFEYVY
jgi:hypothetical protein